MVTLVHLQAIGRFSDAVTLFLNKMNIAHSIRRYPGATIRGEDGSGKDADHGWGPLPVPQGFADKPTVKLSGSAKLEEDVRWWLHPARDKVNLAVTIKVDKKKPHLIIDKWQYANGELERLSK